MSSRLLAILISSLVSVCLVTSDHYESSIFSNRIRGRYAKLWYQDDREHVDLCLIRSKGPCEKGQHFGLLPKFAVFIPSCDNYGVDCGQQRNSSDCITMSRNDLSYSLENVAKEPGLCLWSTSKHPCRGYPANYRLYKKTGRCYPVQDRKYLNLPLHVDPCRGNKAFRPIDRNFGICDCFREYDIYWPPTDDCYRSNTQGPCAAGQWLVLGKDNNPTCQSTSCPTDGDHILLENPLNGYGGCYRVVTSSDPLILTPLKPIYSKLPIEGPCPEGTFLRRTSLFPETLECTSNIKYSIAFPSTKKCPPGSKMSLSGHCKPVFKY